jgi:hypothetical protein
VEVAEQLDSVTIERLRRQGELLLKVYEAEFSIDPTSGGTESSRSNLIALQHTVKQVYGDVFEPDVNTGNTQNAEQFPARAAFPHRRCAMEIAHDH